MAQALDGVGGDGVEFTAVITRCPGRLRRRLMINVDMDSAPDVMSL